MNIQICSDLHLEFKENRKWLKEHPLTPSGDILIIAGDTYYLEDQIRQLDFIKQVSDEFQVTYLIPGNHEYYNGYDVATAMEPTFEKLRDNVMLVNNKAIDINGYRFIFTTLWSAIQRNILAVIRGMTDFRSIKFRGEPFNVNHYNQVHQSCLAFLEKEIAKEGKKLVVTHHLPSEECNVAEFKGSLLNDAFCVDKTTLIAQSAISAWIYGHSHRNKEDFDIGGTQMITNQLGYVGYHEHLDFDQNKQLVLGD